MENMIKDLIIRLFDRKRKEEVLVEKYKIEELQELVLISAGKIIEIDYIIHELKVIIKYKSKSNNYKS